MVDLLLGLTNLPTSRAAASSMPERTDCTTGGKAVNVFNILSSVSLELTLARIVVVNSKLNHRGSRNADLEGKKRPNFSTKNI